MGVYGLGAVGMATISLRRMDVRAGVWLGLAAHRIWTGNPAALSAGDGRVGTLRHDAGIGSRKSCGRARENSREPGARDISGAGEYGWQEPGCSQRYRKVECGEASASRYFS